MGRNINDVIREERAKKITDEDLARALGNATDKMVGSNFAPDFTIFNNARYDETGQYSQFNDGKYAKFENTMKKHNLGERKTDGTEETGKPAGASDSYGKKGVEALKYIFGKKEDPNGVQNDADFQKLQKQLSQTSVGGYNNGSAAISPEAENKGNTAEDKKVAEAAEQKKQKDAATAANNIKEKTSKYAFSEIKLA